MFEEFCRWVGEINWVAVGFLVISGFVTMMYRRWRTTYYNNNPQLVARDQLFNFVKGALSNPRAWYAVDNNQIAFNIDTASNAKDNSITGPNSTPLIGQVGAGPGVAPPAKSRNIQIGYDKPDRQPVVIIMPNGQDVCSVFTRKQIRSIRRIAKRIGSELDNIAKGQQIMSFLPAIRK